MFDKSCWKKKNSEKEGVQQPNLNIFKFSKVVSIKTFRWIFQLLFPKKLRTVVIHNNQVYLIFLITMVVNVDTQRGFGGISIAQPHSGGQYHQTQPLRELHVGCVHEGVVFMKVSFILIDNFFLNLLEDDKAWLYVTSDTLMENVIYKAKGSLVSAVQKWWSHFLLICCLPLAYLTFSAFVYHTCHWYLALNNYEMMSWFLRCFF